MAVARSASTGSTSSATAVAGVDPALEERLTSLLASSEYSVSRYLNIALADPEEDDGASSSPEETEQRLEQRMASLALQLQMRTQSCHDEIGRIGAELQAVVPRCAADVGRLRVGLEGMELDVRGLLEGMDEDSRGGREKKGEGPGADAGGGENRGGGGDPLSTLHTLLNLRTHLTAARAILSAASSWDETINSIPMLLSTTPPNLVEAVAALSQLERGARALRGLPEGRKERDAALGKLRTQLEVLLKPQLLHALRRMDTRLGPLQQCVGMYASLGKMEVMREEYVKMRPGDIHSLWFSFGGGAIGGKEANEQAEEGGDSSSKEGPKDENEDETKEVEEDVEVEDFDFNEPAEEDMPPTSSAGQFVEFLPTFYEAVLELLVKERTQSKLVFGPDIAPSIVARVLIECFKPIVGSFEKRLGKLCPPPGSDGAGKVGGGKGASDVKGGTEAIAAAYESTVRFLSLAYDHMEPWSGTGTADGGGEADGAEELPAGMPDAAAVVRSALVLIASPFLPYQRKLAEAERDPMGEAASAVARDVRGVAVSLEDAAERLGGLAPFMFPLAEAAANRFERLNSGYNAPSTLSSIDVLLSNHATELAIAMGTLSSNASSINKSGPEFDERHVNCALEILRIAGMFKQNLRSFESSIRDRLRVLSKIIAADAKLLEDGTVPDELSPNQIRALLAKEACDPNSTYIDDGSGNKCPSTVVELRRLAGSANGKDSSLAPLFPKALDSTSRLAHSCRSFVFEVCYAIPERHLNGISALPVWKKEAGSEGDDEASYGILPQPFITHVGEHMLALVQALEPFASDPEALGLANEVMDGVMEVAMQPWREFVAAAGCSADGDEMSRLHLLMRGKDLSRHFLENDEDEGGTLEEKHDEEDDEDEDEDPDARASAAFCNQWLDVVGLAVTGRLLERTMRIPRLGKRGAEHLAIDLDYVRNVFAALGVAGHPHPLLGYVARLATLDDVVLRSGILHRRKQGSTDGEGDVGEVITRAEIRIAYVRGIST